MFGFGLLKKRKNTQIQNPINNIYDENWDQNLSWSDKDKNAKNKDFSQSHNDISVAENESISSSMFKKTNDADTIMVVFVRKLENYPETSEIIKHREFLKNKIEELEKAKEVLSTISDTNTAFNPALTTAYTTIDSDLRHAVIEQQTFESKLKAEIQSIESLLNTCKKSLNQEKILILASLYGFEVSSQGKLYHAPSTKDIANKSIVSTKTTANEATAKISEAGTLIFSSPTVSLIS